MDSIFGKGSKNNVSKALRGEAPSISELRLPLESKLAFEFKDKDSKIDCLLIVKLILEQNFFGQALVLYHFLWLHLKVEFLIVIVYRYLKDTNTNNHWMKSLEENNNLVCLFTNSHLKNPLSSLGDPIISMNGFSDLFKSLEDQFITKP
jgi:hypothetical protein